MSEHLLHRHWMSHVFRSLLTLNVALVVEIDDIVNNIGVEIGDVISDEN